MKIHRFCKIATSAILCFAISSCQRTEVPQEMQTITADYGISYSICVSVPKGYDPGRVQGYRLLIYTDLSYMQSNIEKSMERAGIENDLIAVGIGYSGKNRRTEDLTPTATSLPGTGNAPAFASFIEDTLIPALQEQYNLSDADGTKTFCGHSLGGLFGTYLFLQKRNLFDNYLLISPSLMWDEQAIFEQERMFRAENHDVSAKVFLATGSLESGGFHATRQHLVRVLKQYYPSVFAEEAVYRNKDHSGVIAPAVTEGLSFIYSR